MVKLESLSPARGPSKASSRRTRENSGSPVAARGDLETAITILEKRRFEELRKHGWEQAFARLTQMMQQSRIFQGQTQLRFLLEDQEVVDQWTRIVPETWALQDCEQVQIDPRGDYETFSAIQTRIEFLQSLPTGPLDRLANLAIGDMAFEQLLRCLIVALTLDREELTVGPQERAKFRACIVEGSLTEECRQKVLSVVTEHTSRIFREEKKRDQIVERLEAEIAYMESRPIGD
jgi:hypothetical protein